MRNNTKNDYKANTKRIDILEDSKLVVIERKAFFRSQIESFIATSQVNFIGNDVL